MRYKSCKDGEWFDFDWEDNRHACCDCGLVHTVSFVLRDGHLFAKFTRNRKGTSAIRKRMPKHIKTWLDEQEQTEE